MISKLTSDTYSVESRNTAHFLWLLGALANVKGTSAAAIPLTAQPQQCRSLCTIRKFPSRSCWTWWMMSG